MTQWAATAETSWLVRLEEHSTIAAILEALIIEAAVVSTNTNT
jgi:hypothetical protein